MTTTFTDDLFYIPASNIVAKPNPITKPIKLSFNDILLADYGSRDGEKFHVGKTSDEFVITYLFTNGIKIDYFKKDTGLKVKKPYIEFHTPSDQRLVNNLIAELYLLSIPTKADFKGDKILIAINDVMQQKASVRNRQGKKQTWQALLRGILEDKIKYKIGKYGRNLIKRNDDFSIDQLQAIYALTDEIALAIGSHRVEFIEA